MISFNQIPINLLTPGQYVEFDNSKAVSGLVAMPNRILVFAPMLATGLATPEQLFQFENIGQAMTKLGRGSIGTGILSAVLAVTDTIETWVMPVADGAGTAATGTITVGSKASAAGVIKLYIAGRRVAVAVSQFDDIEGIVSAIADTINDDEDLLVTASAVQDKVTLTCRHKGSLGNEVDIRLNYYELSDKTPDGLTLTVKKMSGGAGEPLISDAIANLSERQYRWMVMPFNDQANRGLIEQEMERRWGPLTQNDGQAFDWFRGSVGQINTEMSSRNSPHVCTLTLENDGEPEPGWEKAAMACAISAYYLDIDPARPLHTLSYPGRLPAPSDKRFIRSERNNILSYGGATSVVDEGGRVLVERMVTNYVHNTSGLVDPSYRDVETISTLSYLRYSVRARISQRFPRYKLASDGTNIAPGQAIVTPKIIKAELIALFRDWEERGLVEDFDQFKNDLLVERNSMDQCRVDVLLPPNLVNQFRVFAAQVQFRL